MQVNRQDADTGWTIEATVDAHTGQVSGGRIGAWHPWYGAGVVTLTPNQIACLEPRLAQIEHASRRRYPMNRVGSCLLPTGADAVLVTEPGVDETAPPAVAIRRGRAVVHLTPAQLDPVRRALARLLTAVAVDERQDGG